MNGVSGVSDAGDVGDAGDVSDVGDARDTGDVGGARDAGDGGPADRAPTPRVSVVMACRNAARFVGAAVDSVLAQDVDALELIVVDDASSDGSAEVVLAHARGDARVRLLRLPVNIGQGPARNAAIALARAEWIAVLDADDLFLPGKLAAQLARLDGAGADLVLLGTGYHEIDDAGAHLGTPGLPRDGRALARNLVLSGGFPAHSSIVYRAGALRAAGGFNSRFRRCEDYDLWLRLSERGRLDLIREPLVAYRVHGHGISRSAAPAGESAPAHSPFAYGAAALTCHFLRAAGADDPSAAADEAQWTAFLDWVAARSATDEREHARRERDKARWRALRAGRGRAGAAIALGREALRRPLDAWRLLDERVRGYRALHGYANAWLRRGPGA